MDIVGNFRKLVADALAAVIETSERGGKSVAVTLQDQTTDMLDLYFLQPKTSGLLLGADTVVDSSSITLAPGHGLTTANSANHILEVAHTIDNHFYQGRITSITGDVVQLASPINDIFTSADSAISTGNSNMVKDDATGAVIDGSVTPVIFKVQPLPAQSGDITRILMEATSENAGDLTSFGGAPALGRGITLRVKRADGTFKNLFTYRDNFDLALHGFDTEYFLPKGGNTINGYLSRITFAGQENHGVAVRLDGVLGEEMQIVISELMNSTPDGNLSVKFLAEGSELQGS